MKHKSEVSSEELKKIGVEILSYIDRICRENHIRYFLAFGSLIGAVRHKGFIPWDDDIDICVLREDYEKFRQIVTAEDEYNFIDLSTNEDYYFLFGRVSDKKTQLLLPHKPEIHGLGVFVDIFPIDSAPPVQERTEWYNAYTDLRKKMLATVPKTAHYQKIGLKTAYRICRRLPDRMKYGSENFKQYCQDIMRLITKYEGSDTEQVVVMDTPYGLKTVMDRDVFEEVTELEFEGHFFYAPKKYDKYLTSLYGDYMKLPPLEKQISSHGFIAYWK